MDALLGTVSDREAARLLGLKPRQVNARRRRCLGITRVSERTDPHAWTAADDALLGTMFDWKVAERLGITTAMVFNRRRVLGVAACYGLTTFNSFDAACAATASLRGL